VTIKRVSFTIGGGALLVLAAIPLGITAAWLYEAHEREQAIRAAMDRHPAGKGLRS
jgi:hypothetical protein